MAADKLKLARREGKWWIHDEQGRIPDHGPYDTKHPEAEDDREGLQQFLKDNQDL